MGCNLGGVEDSGFAVAVKSDVSRGLGDLQPEKRYGYLTVTDFARFLGMSGL